MDLETNPTSSRVVKCCNCGCNCSSVSDSQWLRTVKRKHGELEDDNQLSIPGINQFSVARVQVENECAALREMVCDQQQTIQDLCAELEQERSASASAANEAMSMILRLQGEKAEIQMEAKQFKRFAEEKMLHDQEEILELEDLLYKREQTIQSLTCEVQSYKHRMMSVGLTEAEVEGEWSFINESDAHYEPPIYEYPPLKCDMHGIQGAADHDDTDIEKHAFDESPSDHLRTLEDRISEMERNPNRSQLDGDFSGGQNKMKKIIAGHSSGVDGHTRTFSNEAWPECSSGSPNAQPSHRTTDHVLKPEDNAALRTLDNMSESESGDDVNDRVYTIDSVHSSAPYNGESNSKDCLGDDNITSVRRNDNMADPEIQKLYMRLQALEADRESMKHAIISMQTEKAQLVLLKEIAQQLCKDVSPARMNAAKRPAAAGTFSFTTIFKWVASFIFWRKRVLRSKYMFGLSLNRPGLLMLLDRGPSARPWRCLSNSHMRL